MEDDETRGSRHRGTMPQVQGNVGAGYGQPYRLRVAHPVVDVCAQIDEGAADAFQQVLRDEVAGPEQDS